MLNWRTVWDKVFSLTFHEKPKYIHVKKKRIYSQLCLQNFRNITIYPKTKTLFHMTD